MATKKKTTRKKTCKKPGVSSVAAQLFTVSDFMKNMKDAEKSLKKIKKIGFQNVEIAGPAGDLDAIEFKALLDSIGLKAIGAHISIDEFRDGIDAVIDKLLVWDTPVVTIPYVTYATTASYWKKLAKEMMKYSKILAAEDITLQYHNHDFEFEKFKGKTGLEILLDNTDRKRLKAEVDVFWVARGGCDPVAWCLRMKGRMTQVHLKDFVIHKGKPAFAEVGEGNMNFPAILHACHVVGVKDYIIEQDECPLTGDPFKSLATSLKNLNSMGIR